MLFEAGPAGLNNNINSRGHIGVGGISPGHGGRSQQARPTQHHLAWRLGSIDTFGHDSQIGVRRGRLDTRRALAAAGKPQPQRVTLGSNRATCLSRKVQIDIGPFAFNVPVTDRTLVGFSRQRPIRVHPRR